MTEHVNDNKAPRGLVAENFKSYVEHVYDGPLPAAQLSEVRKAFYAGFLACCVILDTAHLAPLHRELKEFAKNPAGGGWI